VKQLYPHCSDFFMSKK